MRYSEAVKVCVLFKQKACTQFARYVLSISVFVNSEQLIARTTQPQSWLVMQNFAAIAVTAYSCGYSEETLRQELKQATLQQETADSIKVRSLCCHTCSGLMLHST